MNSTAANELRMLAKVFASPTNRDIIYGIMEVINNEIGNKQLKKDTRKKIESAAISKLIEDKKVSTTIGKFLQSFVELYGSLQYLPKRKYIKAKGVGAYPMFKYEKIEDLPVTLRETTYNTFKRLVSDINNDKLYNKEKRKEHSSILSKLHLELQSEHKDLEKITTLINLIDMKEEIKSRILYMIQNGEWNNIYVILEKVNPYTLKKLLNPLEYLGIQRNKRILKSNQKMNLYGYSQSSMMSEALKECMELQLLRPWMRIPKHARYFIADPQNRDKFDLDDEDQVFFGDKINVPEVKDKNYYYPTVLFWKVYCSMNYIRTKAGTQCNFDVMMNKMTPKGGDQQKFMLGIFDEELYKNSSSVENAINARIKLFEKSNKQDDADKAKTELKNFIERKDSVFKIFTEDDYKKECEWFEQGYSKDKLNYESIIRTNLALNRKVRDSVREKTIDIIKSFLILFYKNMNDSIKPEIIDRKANELERAIYEVTSAQNSTSSQPVKPIYVYFKILNEFLLFFNPESPLYDNAEYFHNLFLITPSSNYKNILKLSLMEKIPQIYLIKDKQMFMKMYDKILDQLIEQSIRTILASFDASIKRSTVEKPYYQINTIKETLKTIIGSDKVEQYRNICSNYDLVKEPYAMFELDDNSMFCIGRDDFSNIVNGNITKTTNIPQQVKDKVRELLLEGDDQDFTVRLYKLRNEAKYYAEKYNAELLEIRNEFELFGEEYLLLEEIVDNVNNFLGHTMTEKEKELFISQLFSEAFQFLMRKIQSTINIYWDKNKSTLEPLLIAERKDKMRIYQNNQKLLLEDREDRKSILSPMIEYIRSTLYYEGDEIEDSIIDYITQYKIKIEQSKDSVYNPLTSLRVVSTGECHKCKSALTVNNFLRTYATELVKVGNKTISSNVPLDFCSRTCFSGHEDKEPSKDEYKEINKNILVRDLIIPYLSYYDIVEVAKNYGITFPEKSTYNQRYVTLLLDKRFELDTPVTYKGIEFIEQRKDILLKLAKLFNINTNDKSLYSIFKELRNNLEFDSIYLAQAYMLGNPVTTRTVEELFKLHREKYKELYADGCNEHKEDVEQWIKQQSKQYLDNISEFNFESFFKSFFAKFSSCSYLVNSSKEAIKSRGIESSLKEISELFFKNELASVDDFLEQFRQYARSKLISKQISKITEAETNTIIAENSGKDKKQIEEIVNQTIKERSALIQSKAEQKVSSKSVDKVEATLYKNLEIAKKVSTNIQGNSGKEILQFILRELEAALNKAKSQGKQLDTNDYYDFITNKFNISLGSSNTTIFTYKSMLTKLANDFIFNIVEEKFEAELNSQLSSNQEQQSSSELGPGPESPIRKGKGRRLEGKAKLDADIRLLNEEAKELNDKIISYEYSNEKSRKAIEDHEKVTGLDGKVVPRFRDMIAIEKTNIKANDDKIEDLSNKRNSILKTIGENTKKLEAFKTLETKKVMPKLTAAQKARMMKNLKENQPTINQEEATEEVLFLVDKLEKLKKQLNNAFEQYIETLNFPLTKEEKLRKKASMVDKVPNVIFDDEKSLDDLLDAGFEQLSNEGFFDERKEIEDDEQLLQEQYEEDYGKDEEEYDLEEQEGDYGDIPENDEELEFY